MHPNTFGGFQTEKWQLIKLLTPLWGRSRMSCHIMSLSVTTYPFPWGCGVLLLEPVPVLSQGEGRVLPGQVTSSSQGPHWWAMWGSVSHSRTLRHAAQPCPELGFEPATLRSLVDLLYPLSYSHPHSRMYIIILKKNTIFLHQSPAILWNSSLMFPTGLCPGNTTITGNRHFNARVTLLTALHTVAFAKCSESPML